MKNTKKLTAMMLSGAMALSLSLSLAAPLASYAATSIKITVPTDDTGTHIFKGYQILKGTLSDSTLSDVDWGANIDSSGLLDALKADDTFVKDTVNLFSTVSTATDFAKVISKFENDSEMAVKLAKIISDNLITKDADAKDITVGFTKGTDGYTNSGTITDGYYLVADETVNGATTTANVIKSRYLLKVAGQAEIDAKIVKPTLQKYIVEGTSDVKSNIASLGEAVEFKLKSKVPDMTGYSKYYFVIDDKLSKGFTYDSTTGVTIKIGDATPNYSVYPTVDSTTGETALKIVFRDFIDWKASAGDDIVVTYKATVDEDADLTATGNPNTANLTYSNDPNFTGRGDGNSTDEGKDPTNPGDPTDPTSDDKDKGGGTDGPGSGNDKDIPGEYGGDEGGTGGTKTGENPYVSTTPDDTTKTYLASIKINKTDENGVQLTGADFKIVNMASKKALVSSATFTESTDGTYYLLEDGTYTTTMPTGYTGKKYAKTVTYTDTSADGNGNIVGSVDASGTLVFAGFDNGTYTIYEAKAPTGYNILKDAITVTVKGTVDPAKTDAPTWTDSSTDIKASADGVYTLNVKNQKGTTLPTTGGIGTTIFYVVGGILVSASAIFIITKKRTANAVE